MSVINGFVWLGAVNEEINPVWHSLPLRVLASIVAIILLIYLYKSRINWQYEKKISRLKYKIKDIEKENKGLNAENQQLRGEIKTLTDRLQDREQEFNILKEELHNKDKLITNLKEHIAKLNNTINAQSRELHNLKQERQKKEKSALLGHNVAIDDSFFEGHHGDKEYWTSSRLHFIKKIYPELSIRRLSELTGISKSTISDRLKAQL